MDSEFLIQALGRLDPATDLFETVRRIIWDYLRQQAPVPGEIKPFRPEHELEVDDWIGIDGDIARVVEVRKGGNPRQGGFTTVDLEMRDGSRRCVAAQCARSVTGGDLCLAVPDSVVQAVCSTYRDTLQEHVPWLNLSSLNQSDSETTDSLSAFSPQFVSRVATVPRIRSIRFLSDATFKHVWSEHPEWDVKARSALSTFYSLWQRLSAPEQAWTRETIQDFVQPLLEALGWKPLRLSESTDFDSIKRDTDRELIASRWALCLNEGQRQSVRHLTEVESSEPLPAPLVLTTGALLHSGLDETSYAFSDLALNTVADFACVGTRWGAVTDGMRWRFYSRRWGNPDIGSTVAEFYEFDLTLVVSQMASAGKLSGDTWSMFRRWWLLYRSRTYRATSDGRLLIDVLQQEAVGETRRNVKRLRDQIVDCLLPKIAGGFVAYRHRELSVRAENDVSLQEIAQASLSLAYKLLFVLYAETRGLLPMDNAAYRASSLTTLVHWAEQVSRRDMPVSTSTEQTPRYDAVRSLFRRLDHGAPELGLLRIENGLFGATEPSHAFLERHRLSDHIVAQVLQALSLEGSVEAVFASMDLRHLCMVGDGLLENALWVVDATLGEVTWFDKQQAGSRTVVTRPVADYVAISTVEDVLTPILSVRALDFERTMDQLIRLRRDVRNGRLERESPAVRARIAQVEDRAERALLGVRILDPTMGAGHFLIVAADILTDWIVSQYQSYRSKHPDVSDSWDPILRTLVAARHRVRHRMMSLGLSLPPGWPDDLALIASRVAQACIYGVDVDPVAVSLAKSNLSLWAFARGGVQMHFKNHLYRGNSLLGARLQDLDYSPKTYLDLTGGVSSLGTRIGRFDDHSDHLPLERAALDLWISQFIGNDEASSLIASEMNILELLDLSGEARPVALDRALTRAEELSAREGFVHWDLAFPDVFHDPRLRKSDNRPGFDAVIGSPPTAATESGRHEGLLTVSEPAETQSALATDSTLFERLANRLVRYPGGRIALVMTPDSIRKIGR